MQRLRLCRRRPCCARLERAEQRFFVPSAINPLFSTLARETFPLTNGQDGVVMFGYIVLLAVVVALFRLRPWSTAVRALVGTAVLALLLMITAGLTIMVVARLTRATRVSMT